MKGAHPCRGFDVSSPAGAKPGEFSLTAHCARRFQPEKRHADCRARSDDQFTPQQRDARRSGLCIQPLGATPAPSHPGGRGHVPCHDNRGVRSALHRPAGRCDGAGRGGTASRDRRFRRHGGSGPADGDAALCGIVADHSAQPVDHGGYRHRCLSARAAFLDGLACQHLRRLDAAQDHARRLGAGYDRRRAAAGAAALAGRAGRDGAADDAAMAAAGPADGRWRERLSA